MLNNRSILITGGTGSFGRAFVHTVLQRYPGVRWLVILSRGELKPFEMAQTLSDKPHEAVSFFIGDVREPARLTRAVKGIHIVVHAAALKQVPAAEYNPFECIKTNLLGAQNVIDACLDNDVQRVVAPSTDRAAAPINLYGATKLCSEKLFVAANNIKGTRDLRFSTLRHGNFMGSRGTVAPFFQDQRDSGVLPITHPDMTRFTISLDYGVEMVLWALQEAWGGEIFVPKSSSYRITDVASAVAPVATQHLVGSRPGEMLHQEMITPSDRPNTVGLGRYYHPAQWRRVLGGRLLQRHRLRARGARFSLRQEQQRRLPERAAAAGLDRAENCAGCREACGTAPIAGKRDHARALRTAAAPFSPALFHV